MLLFDLALNPSVSVFYFVFFFSGSRVEEVAIPPSPRPSPQSPEIWSFDFGISMDEGTWRTSRHTFTDYSIEMDEHTKDGGISFLFC